jgi:hypothetical protein
MMMFRTRPHASDPNKCIFDVWLWANPADAPEHILGMKTVKHGEIPLGEILDQDARNLPEVQRGMHSKGFKGLFLNEQEERIRHFHKVVMEYVNG